MMFKLGMIVMEGNIIFDVIKAVVIVLAVAICIAFLVLRKKKRLKITGFNFGPISTEVSDKEVVADKIEIISAPIAGCAGEVLSPPLKVRLYDLRGLYIKNKKVRIEIYNESGLMSSRNFSGKSSQFTDNKGIAEFGDLVLKKTGKFCIIAIVDEIEEKTEDIDILPPGLNLDFWNEEVGSPQYEEKFDRALRMSGSKGE